MKKVFIVALFALSVPQIALGWGRIGHRTIAEIAERNLTPKAKANIERYTKGTPLWEYSLWVDEMRNHPDIRRLWMVSTHLLSTATAHLRRLSATAIVMVKMA